MAKKSKPIGLSFDNDWQAEEDMRTLIRAQEIRSDKPRLKKALAMAKKKMAEMDKVISK